MRVVLITPKDNVFSSKILEGIRLDHEVFLFCSSDSLPGKGGFKSVWNIIRNSGWRYFLWRIREKNYYLVNKDKFISAVDMARFYDIPFEVFKYINDVESVNYLKSLNADVIVTAYFNQMLSDEVIGLSNIASINVHRSFLPSYRGANSSFWQLANNEKETGVTVHYLTKCADEGNILGQTKFEISDNDTLVSLCHKSVYHTIPLLRSVLSDLSKGKVVGRVQGSGRNYGFPSKLCVSRFLARRRFF